MEILMDFIVFGLLLHYIDTNVLWFVLFDDHRSKSSLGYSSDMPCILLIYNEIIKKTCHSFKTVKDAHTKMKPPVSWLKQGKYNHMYNNDISTFPTK